MTNTIIEMLKTNTGSHPLDSGGAYGRNWECNEKIDFDKQEDVETEIYDKYIDYTINLYAYLKNNLSEDALCKEYNQLECKDWDSDIYGVSESQNEWLENQGFEIKDSFNSYNWDSSLSQVIQGTYLKL